MPTADPYRSKLIDSGTEPMPGSPEQLAALVRNGGAKWSRIISDKKIKGE